MATHTILIVEDEVALEARDLERLLVENQYAVVDIVTTGKEAVKIALEKNPSIVLMDIGLADGEDAGITAANEIKDKTDAKIVYITGAKIPDEMLPRIAATKPFGFLTKPWTDNQILSVVRLAQKKAAGNQVIFACYSHIDQRYKAELFKFLKVLPKFGIEGWSDSDIGFGEKWKMEIEAVARRADAAILLISIDFMNSKFIQEVELPKILRRAKEGSEIKVIPVFLRPVPVNVLNASGVLQFQGLNGPSDVLCHWTPTRRESEAWVPLCDFLTGRSLRI